MNKTASMMSLLIVALVALGLMAFVSLNSVTGEAIGKAISRPSIDAPQIQRPDLSRDVTREVTVQDSTSDVYVYSDSYSNEALRQDIIANTIVTCDVAKAMGLQDKLSEKTISICQNLLWPFIM